MKTKNDDIFMQNKVFVWVAFATLFILTIPFLLMKFHVPLPNPGDSPGQINWSLLDFVIAGALLFGTGSIFVLAARKTRKHRAVIGIALFAVFLLVWAELAVGLFGTPFAGN